eukprot:TRINITY_DN38_c0_g1_i1.p1 TRINITY_DN38_c0_g1~~TRINITY_DN38_c0_g1_i1.p1  ORF type:complete len:114 (-),score=9.52 TRINITY_DN38_c0_g1_i1:25-366(-)
MRKLKKKAQKHFKCLNLMFQYTPIYFEDFLPFSITSWVKEGWMELWILAALRESFTTRVYRNLEHLTLNLVLSAFFLTLTFLVSFLEQMSRNCFKSLSSLGILWVFLLFFADQ